jgi:hypothetical protein
MLAILHSSVDFSLQIPGYSIPTLALIGAGIARALADDWKDPRAEAGAEALHLR